ncbi:amidohydrolase [Candidimonas sp. SYP-B2681]|uniref:amidohydrolase family protein n=1 Tax=Candidimonas sp. SYP-B2681 TaxID=2497686 RepID=UPI000F88B48E|nr:amidohydrolase family protein [Candidimonas sp. SYP-B2681]RTZ45478.1 amidohydrolase [Candidimonas sp. SYP-B2681]
MNSNNSAVFGRVVRPDHAWLSSAALEPAIEPDLPIVDSHLHFWDQPYSGKYFVEDFAKDAAASGHNIEATVYVECDSMYRASGPDHLKCVGETEFAVGMAAIGASQKYTSTRVAAAIVGYADLTAGDLARETLEAHFKAGNGRFRGVRQRAKWDADPAVRGAICADRPQLYLTPEFQRGLALATSMGLVFEASIYHPQIPDVTALARAQPDANIVVIHSGSPVGHSSYADNEEGNRVQWLANMQELAHCPNVSVKLGGLLMHLANFDFTAADAPPSSAELAELWRPYIEPCIELFGAGRCMVESNFPVDKAGFNYGTVWNMFKRITAGSSPDEKKSIFSGTAKRIYRI